MRAKAGFVSGIFFIAAIASFAATSALACACCTNPAQRHVEVEKMDSAKPEEISRIQFSQDAKLRLDEGAEGIKGLDGAHEDFKLSVARQKDRLVFALKDAKGRGGSLTLVLPKTISVFEVDPRDAKDTGSGPPLYKEWKLTANASGDGIFRASTGANQKMTLIFHGRGNACTDASQFSHWTLLVFGPVDKYTFYGNLASAAK